MDFGGKQCVQDLEQRRVRMEANFSLMTDGQMPAFRGLISSNRLMNFFRVDGEDFWRVVRLMFGEEFLTLDCRPKTNLDILSLFVLWPCWWENRWRKCNGSHL